MGFIVTTTIGTVRAILTADKEAAVARWRGADGSSSATLTLADGRVVMAAGTARNAGAGWVATDTRVRSVAEGPSPDMEVEGAVRLALDAAVPPGSPKILEARRDGHHAAIDALRERAMQMKEGVRRLEVEIVRLETEEL